MYKLHEKVATSYINKLQVNKKLQQFLARYLKQVAGTRYRKLQERVISWYNDLQITKSYKNKQVSCGFVVYVTKKLLYS